MEYDDSQDNRAAVTTQVTNGVARCIADMMLLQYQMQEQCQLDGVNDVLLYSLADLTKSYATLRILETLENTKE